MVVVRKIESVCGPAAVAGLAAGQMRELAGPVPRMRCVNATFGGTGQ